MAEEFAKTSEEYIKNENLKGNTSELDGIIRKLVDNSKSDADNFKLKRETLHYFMENYNFSDLNKSMQKQFLLAVNNVELYNMDVFAIWADNNKELSHELAFVINPAITRRFIKDAIIQFIETLVTIEWKSVPLHFWIIRLTSGKPKHPNISKELLVKLAAIVRQVENRRLRKVLRCRLLRAFKKTINVLNLPEYIEFCEALYNINDGFYDHYNFWLKLERTERLDDVLKHVSKRFYQIMSNRIKRYKYDDTIIYPKYINNMLEHTLERLDKIPKEQHGWLRFFIVFDVEPTDLIIEICRTEYDLDLLKLRTASLSLSAFCKEIEKKLVWQPDEEIDFIRQKCVDLYVEQRLKKWSDLSELGLNPIEPLSLGTWRTLAVFLRLIENHDTRLPSDVLPAMIESLKRTCIRRNDISEYFARLVFSYANRNLTDSEIEYLTYDLLNIDRMYTELQYEVAGLAKFNKASMIRGLLHGEPTTGVERIEEAYVDCFVNKYCPYILRLRTAFKFRAELYIDKSVYDDLLRINNNLSERFPIYHRNSKVHRLKMRVAIAIYEIHYQKRWSYWSDELWTALLTDYNADNIRYLYELLVVIFTPDLKTLLEKLRKSKDLEASPQVSLMSVVFLYCMINFDKVERSDLITVLETLQPLTDTDIFPIRSHAHLFSYCLILKAEENNIQLPQAAVTKQAVTVAYGCKLQKYLLQPRFKMIECYYQEPTCVNDAILFLTNAPFDECGYWFLKDIIATNFHKDFNNARKAYLSYAAYDKTPYIAAADDINLDFGDYGTSMRTVEEIIFGNIVAKTQMDRENQM